MKLIRIFSLLVILLAPQLLWGKGSGPEKVDNSPKGKFMQDVQYLCMDALEGRLTGSEGEKNAALYIETKFQTIGLQPYKGKYRWEFTAMGGTILGKNAFVKICDKKLNIGSEIIFTAYSVGNAFMGSCMPGVNEENNLWLVPFSSLQLQKTNTPAKVLYDYAVSAGDDKANGVIFYNDLNATHDYVASTSTKFESLNIPVAVMSYQAYNNHIKPNLKRDWIEVEAKLGYEESSATGKNIMGYIDNRSPLTVIISANYDHIGFMGGRFVGADNNASGVAGLFHLAEQLRNAKLTSYNYLFVAFSGKEQNLQGSTAFLKQNETLLGTFACAINMDMIGRFKNTSRELFIGGFGTSPTWSGILPIAGTGYQLRIDSSGYGYSDATSFYLKNIPTLRFSTGYHDDLLTDQDTPEKLNAVGAIEVLQVVYKTLVELNKVSRPVFTKTNDIAPQLKSVKVDLGIVPDFTFNEDGIKIGACLKNKIASRAGFQSGDVIRKIGEFEIIDFEDYIKAIKKSSTERETAIVIKRGKEEYKFFVLLN